MGKPKKKKKERSRAASCLAQYYYTEEERNAPFPKWMIVLLLIYASLFIIRAIV